MITRETTHPQSNEYRFVTSNFVQWQKTVPLLAVLHPYEFSAVNSWLPTFFLFLCFSTLNIKGSFRRCKKKIEAGIQNYHLRTIEKWRVQNLWYKWKKREKIRVWLEVFKHWRPRNIDIHSWYGNVRFQ